MKERRIPLEMPEPKSRKERFAELNRFVTERGGWLTSVPGAVEFTMECLPESMLPDELRQLGHDIIESGEGERIVGDGSIHVVRRWHFRIS